MNYTNRHTYLLFTYQHNNQQVQKQNLIQFFNQSLNKILLSLHFFARVDPFFVCLKKKGRAYNLMMGVFLADLWLFCLLR